MNFLAQLDQLNLDSSAKSEVASLIRSLMSQATQDAQIIASQQALLQSQEASLQAKDFKIQVSRYFC